MVHHLYSGVISNMCFFLSRRSLRIPSHMTVLHVEQEVAGDETQALQSVLECDTKREELLKKERELSAQLNSTR